MAGAHQGAPLERGAVKAFCHLWGEWSYLGGGGGAGLDGYWWTGEF
jgi:hypothetical protein